MTITKNEAIRLRKLIEHAMTTIDDKTASEAVTLLPHMKYDGALIKAGTPIDWNGTAKRAAVDLWDNIDNNPDEAPTLWINIEYKDGYRFIPETITVTTMFSKGECGWWKDELWESVVDNNVYNPDQYAANWQKK
jgi:hypothetical protein